MTSVYWCHGGKYIDAGDGEPDEDFPALDRQRMLKQFGNVTEYCLCQKSGVPVPPSTSNAPPVTPTKDVLPVVKYIVYLNYA